MIINGLMILLFVLTVVWGFLIAWQRGQRRCVRCSATISRRFPYCPWCAQMQFSKTRRPHEGASPPRARASLPTGERLALFLHRKKGAAGKGAPTGRASAGTVILPDSKGSRIARASEPTMGQTTLGTARKILACCRQCGQRIEGVETFCGHCGCPLSEGSLPQEERR